MKIIPLSEGSFTVDKTKVFIPFDKHSDNLQERAIGSLLVEVQPFAIVTGNDVLLLDTGLGFHTKEGIMQLHENLMNNGIDPGSVTKVLLSHLHKDHAGGIQDIKDTSSEPELSFPAATYYVNRKEFEFANENKNSSYIPEDFFLLKKSQHLILLDDTGTIDNYIHYEMSGAHSPYHTVFLIKENDEVFFYGGDVAPQLQQMKNRFVAKYDFDGKKSMELRVKWWEQGKQEHWTFLFYHDIKTPTISL
jgi:glyoxylase-like metal-dependent hydrolase (beta-lactamase superfamily II)